MNHPTQDDLVLHHYGESPEPALLEAHFASCDRCRVERDRLAADLALFDALRAPERGVEYGGEVWRLLRRRLREPEPARGRLLLGLRPWVLGGSLAALLAAAFLAGRLWPRPSMGGTPLASQVRERILLVAVGDHLDRSQMVLLEFANASPSGGGGETAREQQWAEELVGANRLYRQTAARSGEAGMASVLEQLERVLLEIAHSPTPEAREALRRRIESEGTLFKIRVIRSQVQEREKAPLPAAARS